MKYNKNSIFALSIQCATDGEFSINLKKLLQFNGK
jgi:hypothetical protein